MSLGSEFKAFILRGNVVDLAVGVIIGAAFGSIVSSLVSDILMPPLGWATGGVNFSDLAIDLPGKMVDPATKDKPAAERVLIPVKIYYGKFLQKIFDFLIISACLFAMIRVINTLHNKKKEEKPAEQLSTTDQLLIEIRDVLKSRPTT